MKYLLMAGSALSVAFVSTPAFAQDASDAVDDGEIIVTANRTETLLSKTPIALTAVTGDQMTEAGITNPTQLEQTVPNLSIVRGGSNGLQITIRGVTSTDNTEKGDPSAAFMLNGIYIARSQAQEVSFFDVERVEVLRGPQGTLYGRNSTAGVVNVITARPKFDFGGSFEASYGSYDKINATGTLNVPLSNTLAVRAAVNYDRRNSFIYDANALDGVTFDPNKDNLSARLSLLWEPTEDLSLYLVGDYTDIGGTLVSTVDPRNFFSNLPADIADYNPADFLEPTYLDPDSKEARIQYAAYNQQTIRRNSDAGVMGELTYDLGSVALTYLGSYREFKRDEDQAIGNGAAQAAFPGDYWQTSHEVRLALTGDGPLQAQVGAYYFKERSSIILALYNLIAPNTAFLFLRDPTEAENKSVFGQATYEIVPDLKLTGGIRYSSDTKSRYGSTALDAYTYINDANDIGEFLGRTTLETTGAKRTFSKVTWRAGIDYDSDLGLIFASVSTGYKAGGFNDGCEIGTGPGCNQNEDALYYQPETLTAYEAGFKFRLSNAVRLNGTAFHYEYKGLQLSQVANICGPDGDLPCQVTRNAAAAKIDGVELDSQIRAAEGLTLKLAANWLDARYATFEPTPGVNFEGRALARSPKWTFTVGADYSVPLGDGEIVASWQTRYSDRYDLTDLGNYAYFYQPSFTKTDLSLTYKAPGDRLTLSVYGRNLEDKLALTGITAGGFGNASFADPRTFGVRAGVKF